MEYNDLRKEIVDFVDTELSKLELFDNLAYDNGIVNILNGDVFIEFVVGESKYGIVSVKMGYNVYNGHIAELRLDKILPPLVSDISESVFFHNVEEEINSQIFSLLLNMFFIADRTKDLLLKNIKPN